MCNPPQPSPSPEGTQQVLVRLDPAFYILSCCYSYYCLEMVMLVQRAWVHRGGVVGVHPKAPGISLWRHLRSTSCGGEWRAKRLPEHLLGAVGGTLGTGRAAGSSAACSVLPAHRLGRQSGRG